MSESEEEKIIEAIPVPPVGFLAQVKKGVEMAFATKKAAMAAYALFFSVTVGTAGYTASGMSSAELQQRKVLEEQVIELQTTITELNSVHGSNAHEHAFPEHEHDPVIIVGPIGPAGKDGKDGIGKIGPAGKDGKDAIGKIGPAGKYGKDGKDADLEHKKAPSEEEAKLPEDYKHKDSRYDTCAKSCH